MVPHIQGFISRLQLFWLGALQHWQPECALLIVSTPPHTQRHAGMQCVVVFAQWLGKNNQTSSQWLWTQWELGIAQLGQWQPTPHRLSACSTQVPDLRCTPVVGSCVSLWQTKFKAAADLIQALTPFLCGDDDFGEKLVKVVGRGGVSTWPWPVQRSWSMSRSHLKKVHCNPLSFWQR